MRLDKFLKVSRIIKRRTTGNAIAKQEKVLVNGKIAKPSHQLKINDLVIIQFGTRQLTIRVLSTFMPKASDAELMYEVVTNS